MNINYLTIDVFTDTRFAGAQITVISDAEHLNQQQMQKIASEFNLWRTVFILPSETASKKIKIFNAKREFDFGGHASIAAIYALAKFKQIPLKEGDNHFLLEENYGTVKCSVTIKDDEPVFNQFTTNVKPEYDHFTPTAEELGEILSLKSYQFSVNAYNPMLVATHMPYLIVPVDSLEALKAASFNYKAWSNSSAPATYANAILLFSGKSANSNSDFHCRLVGPAFGLHEDPPVGAAMPAFGGYLNQFAAHQYLPISFVVERGVFQGRKSFLNITLANQQAGALDVSIGGKAVLAAKGEIYL